MAAKIAVDDALQRELSCAICLELYSVPLLLPCGHSFCKSCLLDMREKLKEGKAVAVGLKSNSPAQPVPYDESKLNCPTCRHEVKLERRGLDGLVRNFLLDSIIEQYKSACEREGKKVHHKEEVVWCNACEKGPEKARKSCTVCKLSYCDKCLPVFHPNRGAFATHRMVAATSSSTPGSISCPDHEGESMKMYCKSCRKPICYLCDRFGGHQSHQVMEIKTVFSQEKDFLEKEAKELAKKNKTLFEFIEKLESITKNIKEAGKVTGKNVTEEFAHLHTIVDDTEQRFHFEIAMNVTTKTRLLREQIQRCQDILDANIGTVEIIEQALIVEDHEPFLLSAATLRDRLTAGTTTYANCPQNPVKVESSDPLTLNLQPLRDNLNTLNLGYLSVLLFRWDNSTAHPNLQINKGGRSVELKSANVTDATNNGVSGQFNGPSFAVMGNNNMRRSSGIVHWKIDISEKKKTADAGDVFLVIGVAVQMCRSQRVEVQTSYQARLMTLGKQKKKYQYRFIANGAAAQTTESEKSIKSFVTVVDYNKRSLSFVCMDENRPKVLYEFSGCDFCNSNWYPVLAIYNVNYKVELK